MGRLAPLTLVDLDPEQRALFDAITTGKRAIGRPLESFLLDDGGLRGPFNAWLHAPNIGQAAQRLGEAIRYETNLPPKLRELAILTVAAHWRADYEWWAHSRIGHDAGLAEETITAVKRGKLPDDADADELTVHRFVRELIEKKHLTDKTYRKTTMLLGDQGAVELVTLASYYTMISMTLNAFRVPMPKGETPPFSGAREA